MNRGSLGVRALNTALQRVLNLPANGISRTYRELADTENSGWERAGTDNVPSLFPQ